MDKSSTGSREHGVLRIEHSEFGTERFAVESARSNLIERDHGSFWEFVFRVDADKGLGRAKGLEETLADPQPFFEASALMKDEPSLRKGTVIVQKEGYDREAEENLSSFYYFEHESVEDIRVEIHEVTEQFIDATITGTTIVNGSNGREPDATVSVTTRFTRDPGLRRGFV